MQEATLVEIVLDGKAFVADEIKVYEAPVDGKNEIQATMAHTAIALYQISQMYWKHLIFDVKCQDKVYKDCMIESMRNANGIASLFTVIITY